jgi:hypothetical protein
LFLHFLFRLIFLVRFSNAVCKLNIISELSPYLPLNHDVSLLQPHSSVVIQLVLRSARVLHQTLRQQAAPSHCHQSQKTHNESLHRGYMLFKLFFCGIGLQKHWQMVLLKGVIKV